MEGEEEIHSRYPERTPGGGMAQERQAVGVGVHACVLTGGLYERGVGVIGDEWDR